MTQPDQPLNEGNNFLSAAKTIQENERFFIAESERQSQDPSHIPDLDEYVLRVTQSSEAMAFLNNHCNGALNKINKVIGSTGAPAAQ